jgi:MazG family protein
MSHNTEDLSHTKRLLEVMAKLRDPDEGCEWDIEQTFETIAPYTIEEAYEVADAIDRGDVDAIKEELGDLLFQVVFQSQVASDDGLFTFEDVAQSIADKMIHRHPHVFGDRQFSREELKAHWEKSKAEERAAKASKTVSELDGVALPLPSLTRAEKIQKRAARVGFDWPCVEPVLGKIDEELAELRAVVDRDDDASAQALEDELGDVLFSVTNAARHLKVDPELALRKATAKFERRFRHVEQSIAGQGQSMQNATADELDRLWQQAKQQTDSEQSDS